jgi:putative membrane protein
MLSIFGTAKPGRPRQTADTEYTGIGKASRLCRHGPIWLENGAAESRPSIEARPMIKNFGDHAANERTFLAWVRTAIAVMAFGFIVEKFDLFLEIAAPQLAGRTLSLPGQKFGNIAGLALIVLGSAMVAIAAIRFLVTARNIDSEDLHRGTGSRIDVALAALLVLLGGALFIYLSHAFVITG